jgi:large conductance mechanosensitive channel
LEHATDLPKGGVMLKQFRDFLMKGNLIDLAVALIMALAFVAVVNAFVGDIVMPIVAAFVGKTDFNNLTFTIHESVFRYGAFISALITFVSIAAAVFFFVVKPVEVLMARRRPAPEEAVPSDEERRHQELIAAIEKINR